MQGQRRSLVDEWEDTNEGLAKVEARILRYIGNDYEYASLANDRAKAMRLRAERDLLAELIQIERVS